MSVKTKIQINVQHIHPILKQSNVEFHDVMKWSVQDAKAAWADHRTKYGFKRSAPALLTPPSANEKLAKTVSFGLSLSPADSSNYNVCPNATQSCRAACVAFAGKGAYHSVQRARIAKTEFLAENPAAFLRLLIHEINKAHKKFGNGLLVRLNTFSDIRWFDLFPWLFEQFIDVQFYDYTKNWAGSHRVPSNYTVALSDSERISQEQCEFVLSEGRNVAMVLAVKKGEPMPATWNGWPVVDADKSDAWMIGNKGVIGGLRPKGSMKFDSPMVRPVTL